MADPAFREALSREHCLSSEAAEALLGYLDRQKSATGTALPHARHVLVEATATGPGGAPGSQVILHAPLGLAILAPLAIASNRQRRGLGTRLVQQGLYMLTASGTAAVFVLGDPRYYQHLGFASGHAVTPPFPLPYPEAWMAQDLQPGTLATLRGTARCCQSLMHPQYW